MQIITVQSYPPSANNRLMPVRMGSGLRLVLSRVYREWKARAAGEIRAQNYGEVLRGDLQLTVWIQASGRRRDLDNILKCLQDAMQEAGVMHDDAQIKALHVEIVPALNEGKIMALIEPRRAA